MILKPYVELDIIHTINDDINIQLIRQSLEGAVIDITGFTYTFTIRNERGGTAVETIPMTVTDAVNGIVYIRELKANIDLETKGYVYDIEENDGTYSTTKFKGQFIVERE